MADFKVNPESTVVVPKTFTITLTDVEAGELAVNIVSAEWKGVVLNTATKEIIRFLSHRNEGVA